MKHVNDFIRTRALSFSVMLYFDPLDLEIFGKLSKNTNLCFTKFIDFLKIKNNRNCDALFLLALIYKKNRKSLLPSSTEVKLFKKSAEYGSISAMKYLNNNYIPNKKQGYYDKMIFNYYTRADKFIIIQCKYKVAIMYMRGIGVEYNREKGLKLYNEVLDFYLSKNDINSLYKIGLMYSGLYTFDLSKAIEFFNKASFKGHKKADEKLTNLLRTHKLIDRKIINWWFIKANQGYDWAQNKVGYFYMNGNKYVKKNYEKAIIWWQLAADQGHCAAQNNLKNIKFENNEKN